MPGSTEPTRYEGGYWPTKQQTMLLKASLLKGDEALRSWHEWKSSVDFDIIDHESQRMLPLLYRNLYNHGVKDPLMNRYKGVYRQTWYRNQIQFHHMAELLRCLHDAGIKTMILKGAALTLIYYKDHGLRPMADFDVLVPKKQALAAVRLLGELGWTPNNRPIDKIDETFTSITHAEGFTDVTGQELDLHWHLLYESCYADANRDFWDGSMPMEIERVPTLALSPTDQLFHVCVHGTRGNYLSSLRWIADAVVIINSSQSEIDWNRLFNHAQKRRLQLVLRDSLNFLRDVLDAPVPQGILQSFHNISASEIEIVEYKNRNNLKLWSDGHRGPLQALWIHRFRYRWLMHCAGSTETLSGFLRFLQQLWGIDHLWQVPFYALMMGMRRINKKMKYYLGRI